MVVEHGYRQDARVDAVPGPTDKIKAPGRVGIALKRAIVAGSDLNCKAMPTRAEDAVVVDESG